jgi:hypothetical protein
MEMQLSAILQQIKAKKRLDFSVSRPLVREMELDDRQRPVLFIPGSAACSAAASSGNEILALPPLTDEEFCQVCRQFRYLKKETFHSFSLVFFS